MSKKDISIHAPAKGATLCQLAPQDNGTISIHAPAKGATLNPLCFPTAKTFQSTLPRRERLEHIGVPRKRHAISIHAPAKGATRFFACDVPQSQNFNPRSREGSDHGLLHLPPDVTHISIHAPAKGATW